MLHCEDKSIIGLSDHGAATTKHDQIVNRYETANNKHDWILNTLSCEDNRLSIDSEVQEEEKS
jgi:hypothetical protein